jgi:opacity protein-like surface antigen
MKKTMLVPMMLLACTSLGFAQKTETEPARPFFGVGGAFTTNTLQPWQLGVQAGATNLIGPVGVRGSAGITLGTDGPSYAFQGNLMYGGGNEGLDFYTGLGFGVRRENGTEARWTYGPNALLGLEYALTKNLSLTLEGQGGYLFNTLPNATPWRFGASAALRIYLR